MFFFALLSERRRARKEEESRPRLQIAADAVMLEHHQPQTPSTLVKQDSRSRDADRARIEREQEMPAEVQFTHSPPHTPKRVYPERANAAYYTCSSDCVCSHDGDIDLLYICVCRAAKVSKACLGSFPSSTSIRCVPHLRKRPLLLCSSSPYIPSACYHTGVHRISLLHPMHSIHADLCTRTQSNLSASVPATPTNMSATQIFNPAGANLSAAAGTLLNATAAWQYDCTTSTPFTATPQPPFLLRIPSASQALPLPPPPARLSLPLSPPPLSLFFPPPTGLCPFSPAHFVQMYCL